MQRENFINVETDFINAEKQIRLLWNLNMKKHSNLAFKFRKHDFTRCLWENSEQKIIYAKKRVNNFLNNAEQKIIYAEKRVNNFVNNAE